MPIVKKTVVAEREQCVRRLLTSIRHTAGRWVVNGV